MIEFVTLFLGLVSGPQNIELSVDPGVACVEIRLDGHPLGTLRDKPWRLHHDFGEELAPRKLLAIARDVEGKELGRAVQLINLPRKRAEARFVLENPDPRGPPAPPTARVIWEAFGYDHPEKVHISFDDRPLEFSDLERITLPSYDPKAIHFLHANLLFKGRVEAEAQLVFGGLYGEEVNSELTAVMVVSQTGEPPRAENMNGWFLKRGRPLRVAAVERGASEIVVVRERSGVAFDGLEVIWEKRLRLPTLKFTKGDRLRFVLPSGRHEDKPNLKVDLLPVSRDVASFGEGSLVQIVSGFIFPGEEIALPEQQLADAVAVAGVVAAGGNRRRAVLLIRAGDTSDVSRFSARTVREYLRKVRVPLRVWCLAKGSGDLPALWGREENISDRAGMARGVEDLRALLDSQFAVWVEGTHMPGEIELSPQAKGISLLE